MPVRSDVRSAHIRQPHFAKQVVKIDLFQENIINWDTWAHVHQSIEAFLPLIRSIYDQHGLPAVSVSNLPRGTHAVFHVDDTVIKVFAPSESGLGYQDEEIQAIRHAVAAGVRVPQVLAAGTMHDRYDFPYIIMAYISGRPAKEVLPGMLPAEKTALANQLKDLTERLNVVPETSDLPDNVLENVLANERWRRFPATLHEDACSESFKMDRSAFVYVHGDLTGDNVLIDRAGDVCIIDFADSHMAPAIYEWPPIVFDLFREDPLLMTSFFGVYQTLDFAQQLSQALLIHDFGGDLLAEACQRHGTPFSQISSLEALQQVIRQWLCQ